MARVSARRRTVSWLVATYLASVGIFAWLLPHRPRVTFPIAVPETAHLVGFSADGGRLAVASTSPWSAGLYNQANDIAVWDVADRWPFAAAKQVANRPAGWLNHLAWCWANDPGREWLFWQCVGADDVPARLRELLHIEVEPTDIDPTEDVLRIRVSRDGTYVAARTGEGAYRVFERGTGRDCALTPQTNAPPQFGPSADEMTILEKMPTSPRVTVRRWILTTGREDRLISFDAAPRTSVWLTPGGCWLVAMSGADYRLNLIDPRTGSNAITVSAVKSHFVVLGDRLITLDPGNPLRNFHVQVRDTLGGLSESPTSLPTDAFILPATISAAGVVIAFSDHRRMDQAVWNWPRLQGIYLWLNSHGLTSHGLNDQDGLVICDARTGKELARLPVPADHANSITGEGVAAFSHDGRQLAVLGANGLVRIYDWPLGRPWLFISALAAFPPLFGGLVVASYRRIRRRGPS